MPKFINSSCHTYGHCSICNEDKSGIPTTYSAITKFNTLGAVRISDIITADCGHTGTVATGSSIVFIDAHGAATRNSTITGNYTATFTEDVGTIGEE